MADRLAVWLYDVKVAIIERDRRRLKLEYLPETFEIIPLGTPLLSLSLPLTSERFGNEVVRRFLDGLLPEGDARRSLAEKLGLRADESFGLISALGRDCAGALVICPADESVPPSPTVLSAEPLTDEALGDLVANLRGAPLGIDKRVRISLAGVQEKLLLTKMLDSLRRVAGILQATAPTNDIETFLRLVTLNVIIGNGDAHGKNFSLLHEPSWALHLAPAYDLMSTRFYGDNRLAMYIDDIRHTDLVTTNRLIKEATSWGLSRSRATNIVGQLLDAIPGAVERACDETPGVPPEVRQIVTNQLDRLQQSDT